MSEEDSGENRISLQDNSDKPPPQSKMSENQDASNNQASADNPLGLSNDKEPGTSNLFRFWLLDNLQLLTWTF